MLLRRPAGPRPSCEPEARAARLPLAAISGACCGARRAVEACLGGQQAFPQIRRHARQSSVDPGRSTARPSPIRYSTSFEYASASSLHPANSTYVGIKALCSAERERPAFRRGATQGCDGAARRWPGGARGALSTQIKPSDLRVVHDKAWECSRLATYGGRRAAHPRVSQEDDHVRSYCGPGEGREAYRRRDGSCGARVAWDGIASRCGAGGFMLRGWQHLRGWGLRRGGVRELCVRGVPDVLRHPLDIGLRVDGAGEVLRPVRVCDLR